MPPWGIICGIAVATLLILLAVFGWLLVYGGAKLAQDIERRIADEEMLSAPDEQQED